MTTEEFHDLQVGDRVLIKMADDEEGGQLFIRDDKHSINGHQFRVLERSRIISGWRLVNEDLGFKDRSYILVVEKDARHLTRAAAVSTADYPHLCPRCRKPAYIGFTKVDCSGGCS